MIENFANQKGRIGRLTYLLCLVIGGIVGALLTWLAYAIATSSRDFRLMVFTITIVTTLIPSVRRLHDIGLRAWWAVLLAIPGANLLFMLVLLIFPPERASNRWGPPPRYRRSETPANPL